jgi:hypothetical protein
MSFSFKIHHKLRTKALVLELLAAICLVKGGHDIILVAFDHFKQDMGELYRCGLKSLFPYGGFFRLW